MKLSILIPVTPQYEGCFAELHAHLLAQSTDEVEILHVHSKPQKFGGPSTGAKRQQLLDQSKGDYIVFIDADDWVPDYYIREMLIGCGSGKDCFAINGIMTTNGAKETRWFISKDYENKNVIEDGELIYYRHTNHITAVKRDIALAAGFPDKSNAEDKWYSDRLVLNSEYKIDLPMYHYRYSTHNKQYK